jgi:hypothetical protein
VFWHAGFRDHFTAVTEWSTILAAQRGYSMLSLPLTGDYVPQMATPGAAGAVPLYLYWHVGRKDYFATATAQGHADAQAVGYEFVGRDGWVWQTANAVPLPSADHAPAALALYWNAGRGDNDNMLVLADSELEQRARLLEYTFVRDEGYVRVLRG